VCRACFGLLKEGGRLVLEPQNWRSYHRRRNVSNTTRHHYETIKIKPDMFPKVLQQLLDEYRSGKNQGNINGM